MTHDEINIAIAQVCGWCWTNQDHNPEYGWMNGKDGNHYRSIPNYAGDLNAMHEAEKEFADDEMLIEKYWLTLYDVTNSTQWPFNATARQRAEAFLRTLNKWKD